MVEMQPVVIGKLPVQDFVVPELVVLDLRVVKRQRDGVIPRLKTGGDVHCHAGSLLQPHDIHVVVFPLHFGVDTRRTGGGLPDERNPPHETLGCNEVMRIKHE